MAPAQASLLAKLEHRNACATFDQCRRQRSRIARLPVFGRARRGKLDAAWALAQAFLCEAGRLQRMRQLRTRCSAYASRRALLHARERTGYLIAQTASCSTTCRWRPSAPRQKVYIIDRAEQLRANTANALLKTLEEPPEGVMFILLGTSADVMLPTIVSRCQCVPFRLVSLAIAAQAVSRSTGQDPARCRMAVAVAGSPTRGIEVS